MDVTEALRKELKVIIGPPCDAGSNADDPCPTCRTWMLIERLQADAYLRGHMAGADSTVAKAKRRIAEDAA